MNLCSKSYWRPCGTLQSFLVCLSPQRLLRVAFSHAAERFRGRMESRQMLQPFLKMLCCNCESTIDRTFYMSFVRGLTSSTQTPMDFSHRRPIKIGGKKETISLYAVKRVSRYGKNSHQDHPCSRWYDFGHNLDSDMGMEMGSGWVWGSKIRQRSALPENDKILPHTPCSSSSFQTISSSCKTFIAYIANLFLSFLKGVALDSRHREAS